MGANLASFTVFKKKSNAQKDPKDAKPEKQKCVKILNKNTHQNLKV